jgi:ABC-2 type transport system ATP-binding protein
MIIADKLEKKFGDNVAVHSLDLQIQEGEVFGFLGPNGAGKTTTVRMLSSLIKPTSGTAIINGYRLGIEDQEIRSSIGVLTETPGLYENLSAEQNLKLFAQLYETENVSDQIKKYLTMLDLFERRFETVGTYSKGMKQKLAIARAMIHEPQILFLDEPTASLDPESSHDLRAFISKLSDEGRTIFLCTHNLDEADRLCDRICLFRSEVLVIDTPANLRSSFLGRKIVFHLNNMENRFEKVITDIDFVKEAKIIDNKLIVTLDDPEAQNPKLINALLAAGAEIVFIGELRHSLEDVYLQLMKNR